MFSDLILGAGKVYAKGLASGDIAVLPLDRRTDRAERLIGCPRRAAKFGNRKTSIAGDFSFDHMGVKLPKRWSSYC